MADSGTMPSNSEYISISRLSAQSLSVVILVLVVAEDKDKAFFSSSLTSKNSCQRWEMCRMMTRHEMTRASQSHPWWSWCWCGKLCGLARDWQSGARWQSVMAANIPQISPACDIGLTIAHETLVSWAFWHSVWPDNIISIPLDPPHIT